MTEEIIAADPKPLVPVHEEKAADVKSAEKNDEKAKQRASHIVLVVGGKSALGAASSTGNDGVVIPREGPLTVALVKTLNPSGVYHPGVDIECVARLPDKSQVGDVVEVYCMPDENGSSAFIHPPVNESIGPLPVSTGDNVGTCVQVHPYFGRSFRKVSNAAWQVLGG
jgi:hypothetical protein